MASLKDADSTPEPRAYARNGVSFALDWQTAVDEAIDDVMCCDQPEPPDLVVVFASATWSDDHQDIIDRVRQVTRCRTLIGCSSSGVISGAACHETAPGISLLAMWLPGATITPRYIDSIPASWPWLVPTSPDTVRGIILFSDPYRTDAQSTLVALRKTCAGVPMVGALASTTRTDRHAWVFLDDAVYETGAVALTLEGPYDLVVSVSQGGTPIGETWTITGANYNQVITISNRPALDVMHETLDRISSCGYGQNDLLIGFPMSEYQDTFVREDFVARGILGTENATGSITVGAIPRLGQTIQFLVRDPQAASADLEWQLQKLSDLKGTFVGGLLNTCKSRGTAMFGRNDHDVAAVANALSDIPVIGLYSFGELGPVSGVPAYNAFAMSFGVIVERS